ncbi:Holliday junction DNA helicase subunit RuvA [Salinibacterium amurskyense]|uniref:Holliday junction branch migration complex subunit RuvA n=1 Tax=Salinibacterium amurskyense TaxID=205941 RepID=A0A2M9D9G4_9MICO|nr:Holliday junction branch migration protein RuvA [Salinibacterium amurskyense]PJJ82300.1 Holliday junction DNA helicase subunit RuvA [Salinibacterium amurskyense]RLQ82061.1 Holliday junction branch migration protein RuvA [Salinibacterium amurskyense]GHD77441.1 Holliday junction ATP-dependent DNA helicase RuvA [Salinibacterium amurskyense]
MISSLRGTVLAAVGTSLVIEVGGVGLSVSVTPEHALSVRVGSETQVNTALIVREDDLALYGFRSSEELEVFNLLRGVTGVGPKSAMGVLAALSPDDVARAVTEENDSAFRKVSGIGPKTAKLIVLNLAGKLVVSTRQPGAASVRANSVSEQVSMALQGLGWPEKLAQPAAESALRDASEAEFNDVQAILRRAILLVGSRSGKAGS